MSTWHLHITGQVQGVGFRPLVYLLAREYGLNGYVNNSVDGVHIVFNASSQRASEFAKVVVARAPKLSVITGAKKVQVERQTFSDFTIRHSQSSGISNLLLTPDFAVCKDCLSDIHDVNNHRAGYAFTTCTNCGPRYSIINALPYDREHTEMDHFRMCPSCSEEYWDPTDRRYYSQTNSCADCGVEMALYDKGGELISSRQDEIIQTVVSSWKSGKIVAIKGIGGYLLTCAAGLEEAVTELRSRKYRPSKPFAIMIPGDGEELGLEEPLIGELSSPHSPILLVDWPNSIGELAGIAPGLGKVGIMLPYTPLYDLLLAEFDGVIVATSGNISNSPIVYSDEKALEELAEIADCILTNNREITVPQDDSVITYSPFKNQRIVIRRSRGMAPTYINPKLELPNECVLAMGAMLKSSFCLVYQGNTYISQYLGDLSHFDTELHFEWVMNHFLNLFNARPAVILADNHPNYPSTISGKNLGTQWKIPVRYYQHHIAHFGALLGEHNQVYSSEPILGVVWDGTGLGTDDQIWGGEFFKYENFQFERIAHFEYFQSILGDKMAKEPRISALSACWEIEGADEVLQSKFSKTEFEIYRRLLGNKGSLMTSSVGRIFDGVAALLGLMDKQTFEGEAAMRLEALATGYYRKHGLEFSSSYLDHDFPIKEIPTKLLMKGIIEDLLAGKEKDFISAKFHYSMVSVIEHVASRKGYSRIAFSGGVFQNSIIVDLIRHRLEAEYELYFHAELSPNDENISFGQMICYQIDRLKNSMITNKSGEYVLSNSR